MNTPVVYEKYKKMMRQELEETLTTEDREKVVVTVDDRNLTSNDLMDEVEKGTELGNALLLDFITFKTTGTSHLTMEPTSDDTTEVNDNLPPNTYPSLKELNMKQTTREEGIALMERDIKDWGLEFSNAPIATDDNGKEWTPTQLVAEAKAGTEFGLQYLDLFCTNHDLLISLLGEGYDLKYRNISSLN